MPIPKEILAVKRPVNTVVYCYGSKKNLYGVRQRLGCQYVEGRHVPVNGPTVGHIVDGEYIPCEEIAGISSATVDLKEWGSIAYCHSVSSSLLAELQQVYNAHDALALYSIALLRVVFPGVKDNELQEDYNCSFLSEIFPKVALSKNTVSTFLRNVGKSCSRITCFMRSRAAGMKLDHHLLIDGTLKSNESTVNTLSDFSRKAATRGTRDISVLFAFDLEEMEPVCSKCFPGNMIDARAYGQFIEENGIKKGLIVADKGFPSKAALPMFSHNPDLHYLNPIRRNSRLIAKYSLTEYDGILAGYENVTFKKVRCESEDKWLYSFRDSIKAAIEEKAWLHNAAADGRRDGYSNSCHRSKQAEFGTIVLESNLEIDPAMVYKAYESRWEIEIVMRFYKSACCFDETRVHDDYSVIGSEFCDFLATIMTFRMIKGFDKIKLLEKMTYKKAMHILKRAKKIKLDGEWLLTRQNVGAIEILRDLGLLPRTVEQPPKRKRGRPRKNSI